MKTILIASTSSNSGKTLFTTLLLDLLHEKYNIAAFKAGPDYIDPKYHESVLGEPSYNLDLFLTGTENVKSLFYKHSKNKDLAIIEGVMGLFDGVKSKEISANTSSFELAKTLEVPIILLVDCKGKGQSVLAEMLGYANLADRLGYQLSAIILNRTNENNYKYLKSEFEKFSNVPVLGFIPNLDIKLESRHLGLKEPFENNNFLKKIRANSNYLLRSIDIEELLNIAEVDLVQASLENSCKSYDGLKVGVVYDNAFNFYYQDNIELLEELGCEIVKLSPLNNDRLPDNLDLIYLGGGYPELYLAELEKSKTFNKDLKQRIEDGVVCLAECGGMVYLTNNIIYDGQSYKGLGVFDCDIEFKNHLVRFGYNELCFENLKLNTHEFHYSDYRFDNKPEFLFKVIKNGNVWKDGMRYKNTFGFYPHIHFYAQPDGLEFIKYILNLANGSNS